MFLRRHHRKKNGEVYAYWSLVESVRTARGPRQRKVASIGKLPGMDKNERVGWEEIRNILQGIRTQKQRTLFDEDWDLDVPEWAHVNLKGIQVERVRQFGNCFLGLLLWKKLKLDELFERVELPGGEEIEWRTMFCISVLARLLEPSSELAIAESWYEKTALSDLLGVPVEKVNDDRLYRTLDYLLPHKDSVCAHLQDRYRDLFQSRFDFLIYDVTSTYFEGLCTSNPQAKRGYSRDHRPDCLQVCIGLVVTREGLPVGYEVFDGNRRDVTTLEEIVELMESKYGQANRIWVFDRGVISEENLGMLRKRGAQYVVGTPRSMMKRFDHLLTEQAWTEVEHEVCVKLVKDPGYKDELFVLCKSSGRQEKEDAILNRQRKRLELELQKIRKSIRSGRLIDLEKAAKRIGRWSGRYEKADLLFETRLVRNESGELVDLSIVQRRANAEWAKRVHGKYLLRTNVTEEDPAKLWKMYMQLAEAENAFRTTKGDLSIRPIYHQLEDRVQAHIFVCFIALAMFRTLELWMGQKELGRSPAKLLKEFQEIRMLDVIVPIQERPSVRLRVIGNPDTHVRILLHKMGIKLPNQTLRVKNVVQKTGVQLL